MGKERSVGLALAGISATPLKVKNFISNLKAKLRVLL